MHGKKVAIIGLGLLGASLAFALQNRGYFRLGWTRNLANLKQALADDAIDAYAQDVQEVVKDADLVVLCLPIDEIINYAKRLIPVMKKGAILTDVGSVKGVICKTIQPLAQAHDIFFIGSHPMTGTEHSGYHAAMKTLYVEAPVFVTPDDATPADKLDELIQFWTSCECHVIQLSCEKHDKIVAHTSHISHLLASILTLTVLERVGGAEQHLYDVGCAGGFRDTTRIASSDAAMWRLIIERNAPEVIDAMLHFKETYDDVMQMIQTGDFDAFESSFARGKLLRDKWLKQRYDFFENNPKNEVENERK